MNETSSINKFNFHLDFRAIFLLANAEMQKVLEKSLVQYVHFKIMQILTN